LEPVTSRTATERVCLAMARRMGKTVRRMVICSSAASVRRIGVRGGKTHGEGEETDDGAEDLALPATVQGLLRVGSTCITHTVSCGPSHLPRAKLELTPRRQQTDGHARLVRPPRRRVHRLSLHRCLSHCSRLTREREPVRVGASDADSLRPQSRGGGTANGRCPNRVGAGRGGSWCVDVAILRVTSSAAVLGRHWRGRGPGLTSPIVVGAAWSEKGSWTTAGTGLRTGAAIVESGR
jgi:hypothetical protein